MNSFISPEEALHSMIVFLKPRHRHVLSIISTLGGKTGELLPDDDWTVLQSITDASNFQSSTVNEVVNHLEAAKLIKRTTYHDDDGKPRTKYSLINPGLYYHWAIDDLLDEDMLWEGDPQTVFKSKKWQDGLDMINQ